MKNYEYQKKAGKKTSQNPSKNKHVLCEETPFLAKEAYKALRTNVMFSLPGGGSKCVGVTSSVPSEGKSTTAINLAMSMDAVHMAFPEHPAAVWRKCSSSGSQTSQGSGFSSNRSKRGIASWCHCKDP